MACGAIERRAATARARWRKLRSVPELFGSYTVHEELGMGGMATVHLAQGTEGPAARKRVALKRLLPHIQRTPELLSAFIDEARLARYLKHPNIAQVYEFGRI